MINITEAKKNSCNIFQIHFINIHVKKSSPTIIFEVQEYRSKSGNPTDRFNRLLQLHLIFRKFAESIRFLTHTDRGSDCQKRFY